MSYSIIKEIMRKKYKRIGYLLRRKEYHEIQLYEIIISE